MKKNFLSILAVFYAVIIFAQPVNDDPANAINVPIGTTYFTSSVSGTTIAATKTTGLCCSSSAVYDDVWYKLEVTGAANSNVSIALRNIIFSPAVSNYLQMNLWNGSLTTKYAGTNNGIYNQFSLGNGTWYVQVWTDGNAVTERSSFDISIKALPAATLINDDCAGAVTLTSNMATCITTAINNTIATTSSPAPTNVSAKNDAWYKFTATATAQLVTISDVMWTPGIYYPNIAGIGTTDINIELGQGICGSYTSLNNSNGGSLYASGLTIGAEYFVRVSSVSSLGYTKYFDGNICIASPPLNDEVAGAITLTPSTGNCFTAPGNILGGNYLATPSAQPTCFSGATDKDVWYNFTATNDYFHAFLDIAEAVQMPTMELWNSAATSRLTCVNSNQLDYAVSNGTNYKLRVAGYGGTQITYTLKTRCSIAPPINDNCTSPTTLPLNANINTVALSSQTTAGASLQVGLGLSLLCAGTNEAGDIWYSFTANKNSVTIELRNIVTTGSAAMSMALYAGCGTTPMASSCSNSLTATTFMGETYLLRIMKTSGCETVTFNIHTSVPPAPVNDECAQAASLPVTSLKSCNTNILQINGSTYNATQSADVLGSATCNVGNNDDVWYSFNTSATATKYALMISEKTPNSPMSIGFLQYILYDVTAANCGSKTFVECGFVNDYGEFTFLNTSPSKNYVLRIYTSNIVTVYDFKIGIIGLDVSANTTCATATTLVATSNMTAAYTVGNTLGVPTDEGDCFGGVTGNRGVWYQFTAASATQLLDIGCTASIGGAYPAINAKVYSGACGALTQLFCFDNIGSYGGTLTGLTVGQTYYVLLLDFTANSEPVVFTVRVVGGSPANDEVAGAVNLIQDVVCNSTLGTTNNATLTAAPACLHILWVIII